MKKFAFLFFLSCYCILLSAQESNQPLFREGVNNFYLGYGAGNFSQEFLRDIAGLNNDNNDVSYKTVGPLFIKYEHGFDDKVSMGFNFAYMRNSISYREEGFQDSAYFYNADLSCTTWSILARVNYHIGDNDKIDPYIGLGMGYRAVSWRYDDDDPFNNSRQNRSSLDLDIIPSFPLGMDLTFGIRIMPIPQFGLFAEVGVAKGIVQGGITTSF